MRSSRQADPWRGNLYQGKDRDAWDIATIDKVLALGANPRASIEVVLRSANTVRRCVESANGNVRDMTAVLRHPSIVPMLHYWMAGRTEPGPAGARLKEHIVFTFINLLGNDKDADELLVYNDHFLNEIIGQLAIDENPAVAIAVAQLIRKVSELDHVCGVVCFSEVVLNAAVEGLSIAFESHEHNCLSHYLSAFINLTSNSKAQFSLARHQRLTGTLLNVVQSGLGVLQCQEIKLATLAAKCIANLLYFPENVDAIKASHRDLIEILVECVRTGEENHGDRECSALGTVAAIALDYCHDKGVGSLESDMAIAMQQSPTSQRFADGPTARNTGRRDIDLH